MANRHCLLLNSQSILFSANYEILYMASLEKPDLSRYAQNNTIRTLSALQQAKYDIRREMFKYRDASKNQCCHAHIKDPATVNNMVVTTAIVWSSHGFLASTTNCNWHYRQYTRQSSTELCLVGCPRTATSPHEKFGLEANGTPPSWTLFWWQVLYCTEKLL